MMRSSASTRATHSSHKLPALSLKFNIPKPERKQINIDEFIHNIDLELYTELDEEKREEYLANINAIELFDALKEVEKQLARSKLDIHYLTHFLEQNNPKMLIGIKQRRSTLAGSRESLGLALSHKKLSEVAKYRKQRHSDLANSGESDTELRLKHRRKISNESPESITVVLPTRITFPEGGMSSRRSMTATGTLSLGRRAYGEYHLSFQTKAAMAEKSVFDVEKQVKEIEQEAQHKIKQLRSQIEVQTFRGEELKETIKSFTMHFITKESDTVYLNSATEKQLINKLQRFYKSWFHNVRTLMATMHLRMYQLKDTCQHYHNELHSKSGHGKTLNVLDLDYMMMKRTELKQELDDKKILSDAFRTKSGKAFMNLEKTKSYMLTLEAKERSLSNKIAKIIQENAQLTKECEGYEASNKKDLIVLEQKQSQHARYQAPSVQSFIERKAEISVLENQEKTLKRRVNIMKMKLANLRRRSMVRNKGTA